MKEPLRQFGTSGLKNNIIRIKIIDMNNEIKILQAILLMAETLNYSSTYKEGLIKEIKWLIQNETEYK